MSFLSSEFGSDARRVREILSVLEKYRILNRSIRQKAGDEDLEGLVDLPPEEGSDAASSPGERLCAALTELGSTWVKLGQSLSMRADLVGADVAHSLEGLQASVPTDPPGAAVAKVESELGRPVDEIFASFDAEPFASGSIAQAHRAVLLDGTEAVVKVIHQGAAENVRSDLALMAKIAAFVERADDEIARYSPTLIVRDFAAMMTDAVDLRNELGYMNQLAGDLEHLEWLLVPQAYPELCSQSVLTMQSMPGSPVRTAADVEAAGWTVNDMTTMVTNAWMEMIFTNGRYHADPHPGNFLVADADHLVLLDYGDVGFLSQSGRDEVARMLLAVTTRDVPGLTDVVLEICRPSGSIDSHGLESAIDTWLATYLPEHSSSGERDINAAMSAGMQVLHDFDLKFPSDLAMLLRVMARLEGFGSQLGSTVTPEEALGPFLRRLVLAQNDLSHLAQRLLRLGTWLGQSARDLPRDLSMFVQQMRSGSFRVEINLRDPDGLADDMVDGMAAAAALLGAAQLLSAGTGPKVKGLPIPGLLVAGFSVMTWQRLMARRSDHRSVEQRLAAIARHLPRAH